MAKSLKFICNDIAELDGILLGGPDEQQENKPEVEEFGGCPFLNIPVEVFLHICSFLDARFLIQSLSKVCKRFNDILSDELIWKTRIARRVGGDYPAVPMNSKCLDWGYACAMIEDEYNLWDNKEETMRRILLKGVHCALVNAVLIMQSGNLCISGSNDSGLAAWDLIGAVLGEPTPKAFIPRAHNREIRDLTFLDDIVYSCSWDGFVKSWDVEAGLREVSKMHCEHIALCIASSPNIIAVGHFIEPVMLFDPRLQRNTASYSIHTGGVIDLTVMNNYIISAGSDNTFGVWDIRNRRQVSKRTLYTNDSIFHKSATSVSYSNGSLYVGDSGGKLHLIDPTKGKFDIVEEHDVGHGNTIRGIKHNLGSVVTCVAGRQVQIAVPTQSLKPITTVNVQHGKIMKFDYKQKILAMGTDENVVEVWLPKSMHDV